MFEKFFGFSPKRSSNTLYGYDLDEWNYLGRNILTFSDSVVQISVFYFETKDGKRRSYHIVDPNGYAKYHSSVANRLIPWQAGEGESYDLVKYPSDYLTAKMAERGYVLSTDEKWWVAAPSVSTLVAPSKLQVINLNKGTD